jgi:hypothetical protein
MSMPTPKYCALWFRCISAYSEGSRKLECGSRVKRLVGRHVLGEVLLDERIGVGHLAHSGIELGGTGRGLGRPPHDRFRVGHALGANL